MIEGSGSETRTSASGSAALLQGIESVPDPDCLSRSDPEYNNPDPQRRHACPEKAKKGTPTVPGVLLKDLLGFLPAEVRGADQVGQQSRERIH
jgi:hypothetical protein